MKLQYESQAAALHENALFSTRRVDTDKHTTCVGMRLSHLARCYSINSIRTRLRIEDKASQLAVPNHGMACKHFILAGTSITGWSFSEALHVCKNRDSSQRKDISIFRYHQWFSAPATHSSPPCKAVGSRHLKRKFVSDLFFPLFCWYFSA